MRKLITICLILITTNLFSQDEQPVGFVPSPFNGVPCIAELTYKVVKTDTIYTIKYQNLKNVGIIDYSHITFRNDSTKQFLYQILKDCFLPEYLTNSVVDFDLGSENIVASTEAITVSPTQIIYILRISIGDEGYFALTELQLGFLFGK